jgi:hypothetical protein
LEVLEYSPFPRLRFLGSVLKDIEQVYIAPAKTE